MKKSILLITLVVGLCGCGGEPKVDYTEPGLVKTLHQDDDPNMRYWAAEALADMRPKVKSAVPELTKALGDKDSMVRMGVTYSLAKFGPEAKQAVPALRKALQDQDTKVRKAAAYALKQIQKR